MQNTLTGRIAVLHPLLTGSSETSAINVTATATVAQIIAGIITSTSASAVTITTPTAAQIIASLGITPGTYFDFVVDNTSGANTVTVALDASITASSVVTGGTTLTVTSGHAGIFRIYFYSATAAQISRIA